MKIVLNWVHLKVTIEAEGQDACNDLNCITASVISTTKKLNYGYAKIDYHLEHKKIESAL